MEIVDNKLLLFRTRSPDKYALIPKSKAFSRADGGYDVAVHWGLDECRVLRNMGVKNVPSPIYGRYDWPGRHQPMTHQRETASFLSMHRRAFVLSAPGTGKTLAALWAADYLMKRGEVRRCLILCPLSIMYSAWVQDISDSIIHRSVVVAHHAQAGRRIEMIQQDYEFVITNYEGLHLISHEIKRDGKFDLIIVDECFVAGTPVTTPGGRRPIETLQAGDEVLTSAGPARIKTNTCKPATRLVRVETSDGQTLTCTPDHPFFTDAGWVTADRLEGRILVSRTDLWRMRHRVSSAESAAELASRQGQRRLWDNLLEILRAEELAYGEPGKELLRGHAGGSERAVDRDSAQRRVPTEDVGEPQGQRIAAAYSRWQWYWHDGCGSVGAADTAALLGMELPRSVGEEAARLSYELQARLCQPREESLFGSGRSEPRDARAETAGQKEGDKADGTRVVRVSHIECGYGVDVYNLEVEGAPNYFVGGGVLVHNCNAYKNTQTRRWRS